MLLIDGCSQEYDEYYTLVGLANYYLSEDQCNKREALRALLACLGTVHQHLHLPEIEIRERSAFLHSSIGKIIFSLSEGFYKTRSLASVSNDNPDLLLMAYRHLTKAWTIYTIRDPIDYDSVLVNPLHCDIVGENTFDTCLNLATLHEIHGENELCLSVLYSGFSMTANFPLWHMRITCAIINAEMKLRNYERALDKLKHACNFCNELIGRQYYYCRILLTIYQSLIYLFLFDFDGVTESLNNVSSLFENFHGSKREKQTLKALFHMVHSLLQLKLGNMIKLDGWLKRLQKIVQSLCIISHVCSPGNHIDPMLWLSPEELASITYLITVKYWLILREPAKYRFYYNKADYFLGRLSRFPHFADFVIISRLYLDECAVQIYILSKVIKNNANNGDAIDFIAIMMLKRVCSSLKDYPDLRCYHLSIAHYLIGQYALHRNLKEKAQRHFMIAGNFCHNAEFRMFLTYFNAILNLVLQPSERNKYSANLDSGVNISSDNRFAGNKILQVMTKILPALNATCQLQYKNGDHANESNLEAYQAVNDAYKISEKHKIKTLANFCLSLMDPDQLQSVSEESQAILTKDESVLLNWFNGPYPQL